MSVQAAEPGNVLLKGAAGQGVDETLFAAHEVVVWLTDRPCESVPVRFRVTLPMPA